MDDTYIVADPAVIAARFADPAQWRRWWPGLQRVITEDRGPVGLKWTLTGEFVGAGECWLEPHGDGTIVHYFLWADPPAGSGAEPDTAVPPRRAQRLIRRHTLAWKRHINALKDELEADRAPGMPRAAG